MDNLSHALAGLAAGELVHRMLPREDTAERHSTRHRLLLVTAAVAGNFPDLDLVLTPLLPAPLGYLLHHRGHTHTLLYAIPQMLLLATAILLLWAGARKLLRTSGPARAGFLLALLMGFGLHLAMDYLNSYGLHPFHPFDARWLYGDMVFILEPVFWIALGAPLAMTISSLRWRAICSVLLLAVPLYFTLKGYLSWYALGGLYLAAFFAAAVQIGAGRNGYRGIVAGAAMVGVFLGVQAAASQRAGDIVRTTMTSGSDSGVVHDVALTAFPSHPFCWAFAAIGSNESRDAYRLTRGVVSLLPAQLPASACPRALNTEVQIADPRQIVFVDQTVGRLSTLRATRAQNCLFDAWLRFARMPLLEDGRATDVRFRSSVRGNFTTMELADAHASECPAGVPQWAYPRADLLRPPAVSNGNDSR